MSNNPIQAVGLDNGNAFTKIVTGLKLSLDAMIVNIRR